MLDDYVTNVTVEEFYQSYDEIEWELVKACWHNDTYVSDLEE